MTPAALGEAMNAKLLLVKLQMKIFFASRPHHVCHRTSGVSIRNYVKADKNDNPRELKKIIIEEWAECKRTEPDLLGSKC